MALVLTLPLVAPASTAGHFARRPGTQTATAVAITVVGVAFSPAPQCLESSRMAACSRHYFLDASRLRAIMDTRTRGAAGRLRAVNGRQATGQTIGTRFIDEQRQCRPAPVAFDAASTTFATVTPRALIRLEGAVYSVWTRWVGLDLVIRIGPSTVTIIGRDGTRTHHPRKRFGERAIDYRHYYRSSPASRRRCDKCSRTSSAIWARPFRPCGITSAPRMIRARPRASSRRSSASSTPTAPPWWCPP